MTKYLILIFNMEDLDINLYKRQRSWIVSRGTGTSPEYVEAFASIEDASAQLEKLGVPDEEIDAALIEMAANEHCHVLFGDEEKYKFVMSDEESPNEIMGTA
jgi:hypothetical protein